MKSIRLLAKRAWPADVRWMLSGANRRRLAGSFGSGTMPTAAGLKMFAGATPAFWQPQTVRSWNRNRRDALASIGSFGSLSGGTQMTFNPRLSAALAKFV
jgi:hypothetical protein